MSDMSKKLLRKNKKGELFPCDESSGLQYACDRYNAKLNECYKFIENATSNPISPIQQNLVGKYYTSSVYKEFFGAWCDYMTRKGTHR